MNCPNCGTHTLRVIDSCDTGKYIFRRRRCIVCGKRVFTTEFPDPEARGDLARAKYEQRRRENDAEEARKRK